MLLILVALIVRGVAFEYRSKHGDTVWRERWDLAISISSFVPALLWGVAFANIVRGVPLEVSELGNVEYAGGFFNLLNPYALLGGLVTLTLFLTHGAIFLALKTDGPIRTRSNEIAGKIGLVAAVLAVTFLVWTQLAYSEKAWTWIPILGAAGMWVAGLAANRVRREGWAFFFSAATLLLAVVSLFSVLYPNVMPNIDRLLPGLDINNASSTDYTLKVMTIVAVVFTPIVLVYQSWTYWIFRKRLSADQIPSPESGTLGLEEVKA